MDRRSFIKIAAASALAVGAKGANAAIFDSDYFNVIRTSGLIMSRIDTLVLQSRRSCENILVFRILH